MSEFEKEYQSLRLEIGDYDRLLGHGDVVDKFKDWQPPKELFKIPKLVADFIEHKRLIDIAKSSVPVNILDWLNEQTGHADFDICVSHLIKIKAIGYTVEKEPKFSLVNKITGEYLVLPAIEYRTKNENIFDKSTHLDENNLPKWKPEMYQFTEVEIAIMETGSYERIEVDE